MNAYLIEAQDLGPEPRHLYPSAFSGVANT